MQKTLLLKIAQSARYRYMHKVALFYFALLLCVAKLCYAQNIARINILGPSGLQANSYTGNLFYPRGDLFIPGRVLSVDISFSYNSSERTKDWGYGYGWTFTYNQFYAADGTSGNIILYKGDGRKDYFRISGRNYIAPVGVFDVLTQYESSKFRLTSKDGTQYFFDNPVQFF